MRFKLYLKNAALLTAGGFALRALGMAFRVYLAAHLGGEGMGVYQLILAVYGVFTALATAGVNVASTRLAAQSLARGRGMEPTLWGLVSVSACLGTAAMLAQFALAPWLARWCLHDARAVLGLRVLAPSLPFMAAAGALRGCFMARRRVAPNVAAQMAEQLVRMLVAAAALAGLHSWGTAYACAAVLLGNTVSEAFSCMLMALFARREPAFRPQPCDPARGFTLHELWRIAWPVQSSRLLVSALQAVESSLLPMCLALHLGRRSEAVAQYGTIKGMALPLVFFPFTVLSALAGLLMPEIVRAKTRGDRAALYRLVDTTLRTTGLFAALAGAGLVLFGRPAAALLFRDEQAGAFVQALGWIAPFLYFESMLDGILKGLGEQLATFRYTVLDCGVRILLICCLVPRQGAAGFLGVMVVSNLLTFVLELQRILRCLAMRPALWAWFFAPAALALLAGGAVWATGQGLAVQLPLFCLLGGAPAALLLGRRWRGAVRRNA